MIPKRYLFIFFLLTLLLVYVSLTGCGGGGDNWEEPKQPCKLDQPSPCNK